jgi:hypothetical protein
VAASGCDVVAAVSGCEVATSALEPVAAGDAVELDVSPPHPAVVSSSTIVKKG